MNVQRLPVWTDKPYGSVGDRANQGHGVVCRVHAYAGQAGMTGAATEVSKEGGTIARMLVQWFNGAREVRLVEAVLWSGSRRKARQTSRLPFVWSGTPEPGLVIGCLGHEETE